MWLVIIIIIGSFGICVLFAVWDSQLFSGFHTLFFIRTRNCTLSNRLRVNCPDWPNSIRYQRLDIIFWVFLFCWFCCLFRFLRYFHTYSILLKLFFTLFSPLSDTSFFSSLLKFYRKKIMRFFLLGNFAILSYNAQVELGYCSNFSNRERLKF